MTIELLFKELKALRKDVNKLAGTRLDQEAFANRLGVSKRTLYNRVQAGSVPLPDPDGKWLLANIMDWEDRQSSSATASMEGA